MLKRTPGKWTWGFSKDPETYGKPGIFIEGDEGEPLTPTIGDLELMAHAPEMYEALWMISNSLTRGLNTGAFPKDKSLVYGIMKGITALLKEINVERQDKARRRDNGK